MTATERQLLHRLASDLDAGFPALVEFVQNELYSGLRGMCRNDADAADATQETLLRAFRALDSYSSQRITQLKLRSWLWTIALNVVRNAARSRSRRPQEVALVAAAHVAGSGAAGLDPSIDTASWIRRLERLPAAQRTAVVLRHVVDMPYGEIAAATDRPVGTVKADVHRAIAALRDIIDREENV